MNKMSGLYKIVNKINGNFYIGSSNNIHRRFLSHLNGLRKNKHCNKHLQLAWNKYGKDNFYLEIYKICEPNDLIIEEQKELDVLVGKDECYNINKNADRLVGIGEKREQWIVDKIRSSNLGKKRTVEQKKQMSKIKSGTKFKIETIKKMMGRKSSVENIKKAYTSNIGRIYTDSHKKNISISLKNKHLTRNKELKLKIKESVIKSIKNGYGVRCKLKGKHEEIKALYLSKKYNQKQLSTMYNVKPTSIYKLLKRLGVK